MSLVVLGLVIGLFFGVGVTLVLVAAVPERPSLANRVLPHVPEVAARLGSPPIRQSVQRPSWGGALQRRLARAGVATTVAEHRVERLRWGAVGLAAVAVGWLVAGLDPMREGNWLLLATGGAFAAGVVARDLRLVCAARRRQSRMAEELPAVAEQISWALWAGLPIEVALSRVVERGRGILVAELARVDQLLADGLRLSAALRLMGEGAVPPPVERYLLSLGVGLERGSPMTDLAAAQASAALEAARGRARRG